MANRFVRRIRSGDIVSIGELKSEFRELAKHTHPDMRDGAQAEFAAARSEFEAALRDFEKHRFGARASRVARESSVDHGTADSGEPITEEAWSCLVLFLKRGFPKDPRHEKELLRYEYARWRLEQTLGSSRAEHFRAFESGLLDMKASGEEAAGSALRLLRDLLDFRFAGLPAMRTHVVLSLGRLKSDRLAVPAVVTFLSDLAADLGVGGELGP